ncbi:MAG: MATE family efflux transporter, partial [Polyangiaceae bacterium]
MKRERYKTILVLALPIMGGMVSQNVMNLVDTAMVGTLGDAALAAVGMSSFANFMAQAFLMGLSSGVQAMAARRLGEAATDRMAVPLNGGLLVALVIGIPLSILLFTYAPLLYPYLNDDPQVIAEGVPYLRARLCSITAVGMNFAFRGYFNGINLSKIYLRSLLIMHAFNLVLSYGLIFGEFGMPQLGATGAGVGSAIATYIGTIVYIVMALRVARGAGFLRGLPDRETMKKMLQLSVPSGFRQLFFAGGLTALFWIVGRVSTTALAAANVVINLMLVGILPGIGLGLAAASLVGQSLGRGEPDDAKQWGWDVVKVGVLGMGVVGLPMLLVPDLLLGVFIHDAGTLAEARVPLMIIGGVIAVDAVGLVLQNALLGAGDSTRVMVLVVGLQWLVFLPAAYLVGPVWGYGLVGIWVAQAIYRAIQASMF